MSKFTGVRLRRILHLFLPMSLGQLDAEEPSLKKPNQIKLDQNEPTQPPQIPDTNIWKLFYKWWLPALPLSVFYIITNNSFEGIAF